MANSIFEQNIVGNTPSSSKTFNRAGVIYLKIINPTGLQVEIIGRNSGPILLAAGQSVEWWGHPDAPTELNYKVRFSNVAPTTDSITILTTSVYGPIE